MLSQELLFLSVLSLTLWYKAGVESVCVCVRPEKDNAQHN